MSVKFYFYYAEVSRKGNANNLVFVCSGTAESNQPANQLFDAIGQQMVKHTSKNTGIDETELVAIIKQFNVL